MPPIETSPKLASAKALTLAAYACFVPIGVVTVLLGPLLPTLSTRWSLDYSQAGALFTAQFLASTIAVGLSGILVSRFGFRFAIKAGLVLIGMSVAALLAGSRLLGMVCIAGYGAGLGLAVPAANLVVAEVNPERRSASLNTLNFSWGVGAVACPFLVAAAVRIHRVPSLLLFVAGLSVVVAIAIAAMPASIVEPASGRAAEGKKSLQFSWRNRALLVLVALFFIYVGTENGFGGWVASYAKSLGTLTTTMALMTPSFFYASLTLGRWAAPLALRSIEEVRLAQGGLLLACAGMTGLLLSHSLVAVALSTFLAGLGLSSVYPITISLLSREFGADASRVGSLMFTMANLGGSCLPWLVGVSSSQLGALKAGLAVPLVGGVVMYGLFLRDWKPARLEQPA
ncbi:MAG TPA: MFS transporter [Terriglobales bacterium]|nr:MFS transporter [Terriglobales bacterium]